MMSVKQLEYSEELQNKITEAKEHLGLLKINLTDKYGYFADALSYLDSIEEILNFDSDEIADRIRENNQFYEVI